MNRKFPGRLSVFLLGAALASGATFAAPQADAKQQVLDLGKEWVAAELKNDVTSLRRILDDKFVASFNAARLAEHLVDASPKK